MKRLSINPKKMTAGVFIALLLAVLFAVKAFAGDRVIGPAFAGRSAIVAEHGAVATSHPLATQIGLQVLKKGGSAVDAAIAANAALGLMEPTGSGIGGDLFAIVWDPKTKKLYGLNASGSAPKGQTLAQLQAKLGNAKTIPPFGVASVTVPGAVGGWFALHDRFGKVSMSEVLAPTIDYARRGFPMAPIIAYYVDLNFKRFEQAGAGLEEFDNAKRTYLVDGQPPKVGQIFRNPDLAATLEAIATGGREAFYNGPLTDRIDAYMRRIGGALRKDDFAAFKPQWVEPISTNYRGYDVWELPPNTQGIVALEMLNILEGYDLKSMGFGSADALHVMTEAKKLAFADRAQFLADPDVSKVPTLGLLSKKYATQRRALINMARAGAADVDPGRPAYERTDTIYLTTADQDGMMVSLIQSNYRGMGSGLVADGLGFMFQDRGAQFSLNPKHPNAYAPGKRPFHTIIPGFVTKEGTPLMSFGVMGGGMQPQGHVQIVVNMIDFGMDAQQVGDAPRWRHIGGPDPGDGAEDGNSLYLERGISAEVVAELRRRGHDIKGGSVGGRYEDVGGYQGIYRDPKTGVYWAGSEMRKDGQAAGY